MVGEDAGDADVLARLMRVPDPRRGGGRVHPVGFVLGVVVAAFASAGFDSLEGAAQWARAAPRRVLLDLGARPDPLTGAVLAPSAATIRRVVALVDPAHLQGLGPSPAVPGHDGAAADPRVRPSAGDGAGPAVRAIAIDGKSVRRARNAGAGGVMPHLLAASTHDQPVVLAQIQIPDKSSEIPQVAPLLDQIGLPLLTAGREPGSDCGHRGATVITLDALHTQRETATTITGRGAHYVMTVKGNQPHLLQAVSAATSGPAGAFPGEHTEHARGHGRTETRTLRAAPATGIDFPGAAQVFRVLRYTGGLDGQRQTKEVAHGVTSLTRAQADEPTLAALVRGHWSIENSIHWVRDVTFAEDACRARTGHAAAVLASLRDTVIAAIRRTGARNLAAARRWTATRPRNAIRLLTGKAKRDISSL